jgi:hypothetical protein
MPLNSGKDDQHPAFEYLCGTTTELSGGAEPWLVFGHSRSPLKNERNRLPSMS